MDERFDRSADMRLLELRREALGAPQRVIGSTSYTDVDPPGEFVDANDEDVAPTGAILVAAIDAQPRTALIPGALVTVSLSVVNEGDALARDVRLTLALPTNTAYRPGTFALDGNAGADAGANDLFAAGTTVGDIAPGSRRALLVKLVIEAGVTDIVLSPHLRAASGAVLGLRAMRLTRAAVREPSVDERPFYESDEREHALEPLAAPKPQPSIAVLQPRELPPAQPRELPPPQSRELAPPQARELPPPQPRELPPQPPAPPPQAAAPPPQAAVPAPPAVVPFPAPSRKAGKAQTPKPIVLKASAGKGKAVAPKPPPKGPPPKAVEPTVQARVPSLAEVVAELPISPERPKSKIRARAKALAPAGAAAPGSTKKPSALKPIERQPATPTQARPAALELVQAPKLAVVRSVEPPALTGAPATVSVVGRGGPMLTVGVDRKRLATLTRLFSGPTLGMIAHYLMLNALAAKDALPGDGDDDAIAGFVASQEQLLSRALITTRLGKTPLSENVGAALPGLPPALCVHHDSRQIAPASAGEALLIRAFAPSEIAYLERSIANANSTPFLRAAQLFVGLCANDAVVAGPVVRRDAEVALTAYAALATAEIGRIFLRGKLNRSPVLFKATDPSFDDAARTVLDTLGRLIA